MNRKLRKLIRDWVPGIISGAADNDPSGISTYSISGAQFGYQQLWLLLLSTPMIIALQAMCARLGDVKQKGLMAIIRDHYAPIVAISASFVVIISNILTLGADLAGMADALGLVTNIRYLYWVVPVSLFMWYIIVFKNFKIIEKYLLILTIAFVGYMFSAFLARPNWLSILTSIIVPSFPFSPSYFVAAVGLLGTTVTPSLFFWQARQGAEEKKKQTELKEEAKNEEKEVAPGMIISNAISFFIMISTAAVLHNRGQVILSAGDAARALEPLAGPLAKYLFAIGIIGSGLVAIPVLAASTAYVVAETFGWRESLSDNINKAKGFYTVITASFLVGIGIAVSRIPPLQALLYSQVLVGLISPFLIILILFMCNDRKIMGKYVNRWFDNLFGWITVTVMLLASAGLFWQFVFRMSP